MSGTNPVGTFGLTNVGTQAPSPYFPTNDGNWAVAQREVDNFAPHPASPAAMSVVIDAGFVDAVLPNGQQQITEVAQQTVTIGAAPASPNNRIDLVVIDAGTGVASVIAGTAASSPSAPALPAGKRQLCQVSVPNGTTAIAANQITDLRACWGHFARGIPFAVAGGTADALTGTFTPATPTLGASTDGYIWRVRATAANATTTPTWTPDKLGGGTQGPWTIKKINGAALNPGDIGGASHDLLLSFVYNGGAPFIELLNPAPAAFTGDSGSGGMAGIVPAPPAGSAAAGDFLGAGGTWSKPPTMTATAGGLVPTPPNDSTKFLNGAGAFSPVVAGVNNVSLQSFASSGTYTPTAGTKFAWVRLVGGGGGGSTSVNPGGTGGTTSIGSLATAVGGGGGTAAGAAGGGGTGGTFGTGITGYRQSGQPGFPAGEIVGGISALVGQGRGGNGDGTGGPGGGGEYAETVLTAAQIGASQIITIGSGGAGGGIGGTPGAVLIVEYQ